MSARVQLESQFQTLVFLLSYSYHSITGRRLRTAHYLNNGCFCTDSGGEPISCTLGESVSDHLTNLIKSQTTIKFYHVNRYELISYFDSRKCDDKVSLLVYVNDPEIPVSVVDSYFDVVYQALDPKLHENFDFDLHTVDDGIYVRIPTLLSNGKLSQWTGPSRQYRLIRKFTKRSSGLHPGNFPQLNKLIQDDGGSELNGRCQEFAENEMDTLIKRLMVRFPGKRLITVGGASCSGKTTFSRLVRAGFKKRGYESLVINQDNYYKNRSEIPVTADGLNDFECIEAFDVSLLRDRLAALLRGEAVPEHRYSFVRGVNWDEENQLKLSSNGFLIFEGIHGIDPEFLSGIGAAEAVKVYVEPMTPIHIDVDHCFPPNDLRLIRRMIRDEQSRAYPPRATVRQWKSVRIGEERNILPSVETADYYFNSTFVYELPLLASLGKPRLLKAKELLEGEIGGSPEALEVTAEVERLLGLVSWLEMISGAELPLTDCVRDIL